MVFGPMRSSGVKRTFFILFLKIVIADGKRQSCGDSCVYKSLNLAGLLLFRFRGQKSAFLDRTFWMVKSDYPSLHPSNSQGTTICLG